MASTTAPAAGKTTAIAPAQLHTFHKNPRQGDIPAIMASLRRHTQYKPITGNIGTHTGRPLEILAGNHTLLAFRALAEADPEAVEWQKVLVHWVDVDDDMADRIVVADNQTGSLGGFDEAQLAEIVAGFSGDIDGLGFTEADVDDLMALLEEQDLPPVSPQDDPMATANDTDNPGKRDDGLINAKDMTQRRDEYAENAGSRMVVLTMPIPSFIWAQEKLEAFRTEHGLETNTEAVLELLSGWSGETPPPLDAPIAEGADLGVPMSGWRGTGSGDRPWNSEQHRQ